MDRSATVDWLLTAASPTIRYKALVDLQEVPKEDLVCQEAYNAIQTTGAVPAILAAQVEMGKWEYPNHYYTPKYTSSHWSMMLLEELLCNPQDPRFQAGLDFMLSATKDMVETYRVSSNSGFTCLWGNIIRYAVYGGRLDDPLLQMMIEWAVQSLGDHECQCQYNNYVPCSWGAARTLWGLAAIPQGNRDGKMKAAIQSGTEMLIREGNRVLENKNNTKEENDHPVWYKANFPLFYQADILFVLRVLAGLDQLRQPGVEDLIRWLETKQKPPGKWTGSSPYRGRTYPQMGDREETDRWVTIQALTILKAVKSND